MKGAWFTEEQIIAALKEHEAGTKDGRPDSQAWDLRSDDLRLEDQIWRHGRFRGEAVEGFGGRERQAEEASGRAGARCDRAARASFKKLPNLLRPVMSGRAGLDAD